MTDRIEWLKKIKEEFEEDSVPSAVSGSSHQTKVDKIVGQIITSIRRIQNTEGDTTKERKRKIKDIIERSVKSAP